MTESLRDPIWNGIAAIVAIVALVFTAYQDKRKIPNFEKAIKALGRIILGTIVIFVGTFVTIATFGVLTGGLPILARYWQWMTSPEVLQVNGLRILFSSIFISSIVVSSIPKNSPKRLLLRTAVITAITLWVADIFLFLFKPVGTEHIIPFFFSAINAIIGGFLDGAIILWIVKIYDDLFDSEQTNAG